MYQSLDDMINIKRRDSISDRRPDNLVAAKNLGWRVQDEGKDGTSLGSVPYALMDVYEKCTDGMKHDIKATVAAANESSLAEEASATRIRGKSRFKWPKRRQCPPATRPSQTPASASIRGFPADISGYDLKQMKRALSNDPFSDQYRGRVTPAVRPWEPRENDISFLDATIESILRDDQYPDNLTICPPPFREPV